MADAKIEKKPSIAVSGLGSPKRNGYKMEASWGTPAALVSKSKKDRAESLEIDWYLGIPGKDAKSVKTTGNEKLKSSSINLNNLTIGRTTYKRSSFYPVTTRTLEYVTVKVTPKNKKGSGPSAKATREFDKPRAPSIANLEFNGQTGVVSTTITTNAGTDYLERYDTKYWVTVENQRIKKTWRPLDTSSAATSIPISFDASDYQQLVDEYIKVTVSAYARGFAGNSSTVSKSMYIAYPAPATITGVSVSSKEGDGKLTAYIKTNTTTTHPVDNVSLEYLADVEYDDASQIPGSASWESSGISDNGNCSALAMSVAPLIPSRGAHTWIRVKSWHLTETVLYTYSSYYMVSDLETPAAAAADIDIDIISARAGSDGESAVVLLGWNKDGQDDFTGTELSWSDQEDTWKSTESPNTHEFTWTDGPLTVDNVSYHDSAEIVVKDLEEGRKYFIRARRYLDDPEQFSAYSNTATCITSEKPEALVASCNQYIAAGEPLAVAWTFTGNGIQTEWQIVTDDGTVLANGEGSIGSTQISAERLATFATNNSLTFTVQASTGSGFVESEQHEVTIIPAPTLSISAAAQLTAQPFSFSAQTNRSCDLIVIVTSQGASGQFPTGLLMQTAGDTIYSAVVSPVWVESNDVLTATITLPSGLDFWNLGNYTLSVVAVDRTTALKSAESVAEFTVQWANEAVDPEEAVTLTPIDTVIDEKHFQAVEIDLTPPEDCNDSDVYDIYRMDGDTIRLIGEGFPLTYTATDEFAPFGDGVQLQYRIALRTVDGDVNFADIWYVLGGASLRFDWVGGLLELPYDIELKDSYSKDVEIRQHMDGNSDGYWNQNITRTGSLNTSVITLTQETDIEVARQLARYPGPVFVRTPNGNAYEADVQVKDMSQSNSKIMKIAIDATEVGLTQDFILDNPFTLEDEEESE